MVLHKFIMDSPSSFCKRDRFPPWELLWDHQFIMGLYKSLLTITEKRKDKNQDKDMVQIRNLLKVGLDQQM